MSEKDKNNINSDEELIFEDETDIEHDELNEDSSEKSEKDKIKDLKNKLRKCEEEKRNNLDGWQRSQADSINLKKKFEEDKISATKKANENVIVDLLPVLDSFEMAFKDKQAWESVSENWRKGIENIYDQLYKILDQYNVSPINPENEEFDPNIHESINTVEIENVEENNKIIKVLQTGYKMGDRIIREPKVTVGQIKEE